MRCCDISAGDLRQLITIERKTRTSDGAGGFTDSWTADPAGGVYAKVVEVGGQLVTGAEAYQAMRITPKTLLQIVIRFRDDGNGAPYYSSSTDRVRFRGRTYGIEAVYDVDMRQQWLQLNLAEGAPS